MRILRKLELPRRYAPVIGEHWEKAMNVSHSACGLKRFLARKFFAAVPAVAIGCLISTAPAFAQNAYISNTGSSNVSVIATSSNTVTATIPVGSSPFGVAVTPDGSKVYVANANSNNVSVIATSSNAIIEPPIPVGSSPFGVAVTPDGSKVYVANYGANAVSVIATSSNTVTATIPVG